MSNHRESLIFSSYPYYYLLTIYLTNNDCVIGSIEQYSLVAKENEVRGGIGVIDLFGYCRKYIIAQMMRGTLVKPWV